LPSGEPCCRPRGAEGAGSPPGPAEPQLLGGEPAGLAAIPELQQGECGLRSPGHEGWIAATESLAATAGSEQLLEPAREVAAQHAQPCPAPPKGVDGLAFRIRLATSARLERRRGLVELALLHQCVRRQPAEPVEGLQPPLSDGCKRLAAVGYRIGQVASHKQSASPI